MNNNVVVLRGRLTKDPELKVVSTGKGEKDVATFSLAVNNGRKDKDGNYGAYFFNCVTWEYQARYLRAFEKGDELFVNGYLTQRSYEDNYHNTKYVTEVVCTSIMGQKKGSNDNNKVQANNGPLGEEIGEFPELPF